MKYFIYILKSGVDNGYYVGLTGDLQNRLEYHNKGRVNSTKHRRPFTMIYTETFENRLDARQREKYLKSYRGSKEKLSIIENLSDQSL